MVSYYLGYTVYPKPNIGTKPWRAGGSEQAGEREREREEEGTEEGKGGREGDEERSGFE